MAQNGSKPPLIASYRPPIHVPHLFTPPCATACLREANVSGPSFAPPAPRRAESPAMQPSFPPPPSNASTPTPLSTTTCPAWMMTTSAAAFLPATKPMAKPLLFLPAMPFRPWPSNSPPKPPITHSPSFANSPALPIQPALSAVRSKTCSANTFPPTQIASGTFSNIKPET